MRPDRGGRGRQTVNARELGALERQILGRHPSLWLGVVAVLAPLAVLLVLQYWWLADLEKSSTLARRATLQKRLDVVAKELDLYYTKASERTLNVPAAILTPERVQKAAHFFKQRPMPGVRTLFVVAYTPKEYLWFFDPEGPRMAEPEWSEEHLAVWAAISPWKIAHKRGAALETTTLHVDQRDTAHRIIINPIVDEGSKLVGLAGLVLDQGFLERELLPKVIAEVLPEVAGGKGLVVAVRDGRDRQLLPANPPLDPKDDRVRRHLDFVFTDWTIALQGELASPEQWARTNFYFNVTVSVALAVVLVGGVIVTLRTTLREMRLSAMKNEFVSNVSHELRTPLSSIRVFGEFLRRGRVTDPDKIREYGGHIETESRRLTQLINNILDFSRIESGRRVYTFERVDLEELLTETLSTFAVRLRSSGLELEYEGPGGPLPEIEGDRNALDRAVANLLDNAVKYSDGGRRIVVRLENGGAEARIAVIDEGVGIPKEEHERIFERFHRVSTGLVHDVKGTGLGLSLVRHIVEAHGGSVSVESEVGRGSTFTLRLPLPRTSGGAP